MLKKSGFEDTTSKACKRFESRHFDWCDFDPKQDHLPKEGDQTLNCSDGEQSEISISEDSEGDQTLNDSDGEQTQQSGRCCLPRGSRCTKPWRC